jgi:predicted ATPase
MHLHFEKDACFVGRQAEQATLQSLVAHDRLIKKNAALQVCLVHGAAGSGKTSLIHHSLQSSSSSSSLRRGGGVSKANEYSSRPYSSSSYYLISGKCDQNQVYASPYMEIVTAFDQLVTIAPPERIQQCITTEARILTRLIPSFRNLLLSAKTTTEPAEATTNAARVDTSKATVANVRKNTDDDAEEPHGGVLLVTNCDENPQGDCCDHHHALASVDFHDHQNDSAAATSDTQHSDDNSLTLASERLMVAFRVFLREFCSPDHPIVLLIDDLQVSRQMFCQPPMYK